MLAIGFFELLILAGIASFAWFLFTRSGRIVAAVVLGSIGLLVVGGIALVGLIAVTRASHQQRHVVAQERHEWREDGPWQPPMPAGHWEDFEPEFSEYDECGPWMPPWRRTVVRRAFVPADEHYARYERAAPVEADNDQSQVVAARAIAETPMPKTAVEEPKAAKPSPVATSDPTQRPVWVDQLPDRTGGSYFAKAMAGPYETRVECDKALADELQKAVGDYVDSYLGETDAGRRIAVPLSYIQDNVVRETWEEQVQASFGPMKQVHALLEFDDRDRSYIQERYHQIVVHSRLTHTGISAGLVLLVLGTFFSYLKLDTATRGYYTGRLRLAAGAVIVAVALATVFLARGGLVQVIGQPGQGEAQTEVFPPI